jgi:hypothetical protein
MAEAIQYMFDHRELVELLIRQQGLQDGVWMLSIEFLQAAATVPAPDGKSQMPAAINIVQRIGLKKHEGPPTNLTVNAAEVNPAPKGAKKGGVKGALKGAKK